MKIKAAFVQLGDTQLELWEFADAVEPNESLDKLQVMGIRHIAFAVEDLDKTIEELREKGFVFSGPKAGASGARYLFITDPSGVALEFYEEK